MLHQDIPRIAVGHSRKTARIAVLADGENIGFDAAEKIIAAVRALGSPTVLRAYCCRTNPNGWDKDARFQITYLDTIHGKNSADIRLVIDAMDLAHSGVIDGFAILSSDRDFAPLAHRLRAMGLLVLGIGRPETSALFRAACTDFVELPATDQSKPLKQGCVAPSLNGIELAILQTIDNNADKAGWVDLKVLGTKLRQDQKIEKAQAGVTLWRTYLAARPHLFICAASGSNSRVRRA